MKDLVSGMIWGGGEWKGDWDSFSAPLGIKGSLWKAHSLASCIINLILTITSY